MFFFLVSSWLQSYTSATVLLDRDAVGSDSNTRSLWNIVSGCLTTIFACTWIAVHSNIPAPEDSAINILLRRLAIMGNLLLAPELVTMWAARQYIASREISKRHKARGWTKTHAFFAIMGGFVLFENGAHVRTLEITDLERLESEGMIDWPNITAEEIKDKSKGDYFSKAVVVLQTTWFIVQCIVRGVEKMVLAELEVVTLAFSFLTMVIYFLWWNKPLDVGVPSPVYLKKGYSAKDIFKQSEKAESGDSSDTSSFVVIEAEAIDDQGQIEADNLGIVNHQQLEETANPVVYKEEQFPLTLSLREDQDTSGNSIILESQWQESAQPIFPEEERFISESSLMESQAPVSRKSNVVAPQQLQAIVDPTIPDEEQSLLSADARIYMEDLPDDRTQELEIEMGLSLSSDPQVNLVPLPDEITSEESTFISKMLSFITVLIFLPIIYIVYSLLYSAFKLIMIFCYPILKYLLYAIAKVLYFLFVYIPVEYTRAVQDMASCDSLSTKTQRRVPTFYSPKADDDELCYAALLLVGTIFGAIHCIAWSFHFSTKAERLLWRVGSIVITVCPPVSVAFALITDSLDEGDGDEDEDDCTTRTWIWLVVGLVAVSVIILYIGSRFCLLVIPLFSLRSLPPGAYADINWSVFIPHIHT